MYWLVSRPMSGAVLPMPANNLLLFSVQVVYFVFTLMMSWRWEAPSTRVRRETGMEEIKVNKPSPCCIL